MDILNKLITQSPPYKLEAGLGEISDIIITFDIDKKFTLIYNGEKTDTWMGTWKQIDDLLELTYTNILSYKQLKSFREKRVLKIKCIPGPHQISDRITTQYKWEFDQNIISVKFNKEIL